MREKGKIRTWNDDKGFGFITPSQGGKDVFLHISAFSNRDRRPEIGQIVTYALTTDNQGRQRASKATLPGDRLPAKRKTSRAAGALIVAALFIAFVAYSALFGTVPPLVLWVYLGLSVCTFLVYAFDKTAARDGAWRTPESTLHWLSLAGGWPGALIAQQTLRHKSKKQSFRSVFWVTVLLNLGLFMWMFTPMGAGIVQSWIGQGQSLLNFGGRATIEWAEPE